MRRSCGILLAVIGIMSIASCSPPTGGWAGVSVDAQGHPIIALAWCEGAAPERVSISHREDPSGALDSVPGPSSLATVVDDGDFIAPSLNGQIASVRLDAPEDGWTVEPKPFVLRPGVLYSAIGYQKRGSSSSQVNIRDVSFRAADFAKLRPGQVLIQWGESVPLKTPDANGVNSEIVFVDKVISREDFDREGRNWANCE